MHRRAFPCTGRLDSTGPWRSVFRPSRTRPYSLRRQGAPQAVGGKPPVHCSLLIQPGIALNAFEACALRQRCTGLTWGAAAPGVPASSACRAPPQNTQDLRHHGGTQWGLSSARGRQGPTLAPCRETHLAVPGAATFSKALCVRALAVGHLCRCIHAYATRRIHARGQLPPAVWAAARPGAGQGRLANELGKVRGLGRKHIVRTLACTPAGILPSHSAPSIAGRGPSKPCS